MADIFQFPMGAARNDRGVRIEIAESLRRQGVPGERAEMLAREIVEDYREFETELLARANIELQKQPLLHEAWMAQRWKSAIRRGKA